jgi:hypothetical protein
LVAFMKLFFFFSDFILFEPYKGFYHKPNLQICLRIISRQPGEIF